MIWGQALASFAVWIAYGILQARRSQEIRESMSRICSVRRKVYAPLILLLSVFVLFGGLYGLYVAGGLPSEGMPWWSWIAVTLLGLAFVHGQTMAAAMIISVVQESVTNGSPAPSVHKNSGEPQS